MPFRSKITIGLIVILFLSHILLAVVISIYVNKTFIGQVQLSVRHDIYSAKNIYEGYAEKIERMLRAVSFRRTIGGPLDEEISRDLGKVFGSIYESSGIDLLILTDTNGIVLFRAHNPDSKGDDVSGMPIIAQVMKDWVPVSGTTIMPAEMVAREGKKVAGRTVIDLIPTPRSVPVSKPKENRAMLVASAVPFYEISSGRKLGILFGAYLLNRDEVIVDRIREEVFEDPAFAYLDAGTATIFFNDLRISTNVSWPDGKRAVGSLLSEDVYQHVIRNGKIWSDRAFVVNDWCITAYEPIRDIDSSIVGALYVGVPESPYKQPVRVLILFIILVMFITAFAALLFTYFYIKRMLGPVDSIVLMCRKLMQGELSVRCGISPSGEMGLLCTTMDQMADSFERYKANLQRETQLQIGQSEKLASIGRLAAGIAHEINNPLTSVLNYAHLVRQSCSQDKGVTEDLDVIIDETNRIRKIVRELLDFARQSPAVRESVDINALLKQLISLIRGQSEFRSIRFVEHYDDGLRPFDSDKNQLQQVFLNIILNAAESISGEGTIIVTTEDQNDRFVIRISDTGCGIPPGDLDRIFDPFFTTKSRGKGTGLGLSISYGIVKQFGGELSCNSREGEGTEFMIGFVYAPDNQPSQ